MATIKRIEDLQIWQLARNQCKEIYALTKKGEFIKDYRFVQQIRAAAGSVMDNIAEGFGREGNKEFLQYLSVAKGSCSEVLSQLYRAYDAEFISNEQLERLRTDNVKLCTMIYNLCQSLKNSEYKGTKYNSQTEQSLTTLNNLEQH